MGKNRMFFYSLTVAVAGFLFGFDTVVISGANLPIKEIWHTTEISPWFHGLFIMSMALWGTVVGAIFGGIPTEKYGRKKILLWIGLLYSVSALGSGLAPDPYSFSFFRFIGGVGVGISSVAAPAYISEISTKKLRGRLVGMYQFNIVFGILIAYFSNYLLQGFDGANDWRWMLGVETIPAVIYTILVIGIPESPRWLLSRKNDPEAALAVLQKLNVENPQREIDIIRESDAKVAKADKGKKENIFAHKYRRPLMLAFFVAFFNQWSGINFILYYSPEILESAGLAAKDSLLSSISLGGVNLIFTFVGLYLIDRMGRKSLLLLGCVGYIISLGLVAFAFQTNQSPTFLISFLLLFIASHASGQGAVIWVLISEVFPNKVRGYGQSFGSSTHWVFAALITLITPVFLDAEKGIFGKTPEVIFWFFCGMMVLQMVWILSSVPETKGVSLEDLEKQLIKE